MNNEHVMLLETGRGPYLVLLQVVPDGLGPDHPSDALQVLFHHALHQRDPAHQLRDGVPGGQLLHLKLWEGGGGGDSAFSI